VPPSDDLSRSELVAALQTKDTALQAKDAALAAKDEVIVALEMRVAELERRLGRNSGNSSLPPSSDGPGVNRAARRAGKASGKGSGRKRGKQPGAPGSGLSWVESPHEQISHRPTGRCECGLSLSAAADLGVVRSHQVHDVPLITATVVQHDLHVVCCPCGVEHVAPRPAGVAGSATSYGLNVAALVTYLLTFQHLPVERAAQLVEDLTGARPSTGYVHGMLARAGGQLAEVDALIRAQLAASPVVGFDETTLRVGAAGTTAHVLSANTDTHSSFWLGGRGLATFHEFGILDSFTGVAVHDRYSLYDHDSFGTFAGHQLCAAHLLRDIQDAADAWPTHHWPAQADRSLRGLIRCWHQALDAGRPTVTSRAAHRHRQQLRQAVAVGLSQITRRHGANVKQLPGRNLLECLRDREADVLAFTTDTRIPPTNNQSERGLRPLKTQQKISGRFTSAATTRHRLRLQSYLTTATKQNIGMLDALAKAITGNPWQPTGPTPA
jgi:transposase